MKINQHLKDWKQIVSCRFPDLSLPQVNGLATWSFGMVMTQSSSLSKVSNLIAKVNQESENTVRQRLKEWYKSGEAKTRPGNKRASIEITECFACLLKWVIDLLPQTNQELPIAIAAASGRRFSELIIGRFSLPQSLTSPYQFLFEGQLKKSGPTSAYLTHSIVPATILIDAICRFRAIPKVQALQSAGFRQINDTLNAAVNYHVRQHFETTGIIAVLEEESRVTIQNLRGVYGEIATHFFCPNRAAFPRFLSSQLGHLIGNEIISSNNDFISLIDTSNKLFFYSFSSSQLWLLYSLLLLFIFS